MRLDFTGRVAVVTGGGRGLGRATAIALADAGAVLAIWERDEGAGRAVAGEIGSAGGRARAFAVDVTDGRSVDAAVAAALDEHGRIDVLINNAGIVRDARLVKPGDPTAALRDEDFAAVLAVNLEGVMRCTRAVAPAMIERGYGRIVNASSVVGVHGNFGQTSYVAAKSGVIGMTRVWAKELGRHGITVNAIAPGFIDTEMARAVPAKVLELLIARTPAARLGRPEEVAAAYLFLASEQASFVNGAVLGVDGGLVP